MFTSTMARFSEEASQWVERAASSPLVSFIIAVLPLNELGITRVLLVVPIYMSMRSAGHTLP